MSSSIRVWFLGALGFCAVFLMCLDRHWGFVSAARGTAQRRIDAAAGGLSVARPNTAPPQPEPLQQQMNALLEATVIEFETGSAALRGPSSEVLQRIATAGFGSSHPLAPERTAEDRARNRRIELTLSRSQHRGDERCSH